MSLHAIEGRGKRDKVAAREDARYIPLQNGGKVIGASKRGITPVAGARLPSVSKRGTKMSKRRLFSPSLRSALRCAIVCFLAPLSLGAFADVVLGNGKVETERRSVPLFSSIDVGGSGTLKVHRGPQKVEISCDSNILPYVTSVVEAGELKIGFRPFTSVRGPTRMEFDVTLPDLAGIRLTGSGEAYVDEFNGGSFSADISGSGGIKAELEYASISLNLSGSGGVDVAVKAGDFRLRCSGSGGSFIRGSAKKAEIALSGSAELGARDFVVEDARVISNGSSHIEIRATKSLDATLSGSGDLRYWGDPTIMERVSGSGRIAKAGN
jgi:hypothetical protein